MRSDFARKAGADPYAGLLGVSLDEVGPGRAVCSVVIADNMLNFMGLVHGGLVFSLADIAFAAASNYGQPPSYALDVSGSFLRTVKVGDKLTARAEQIQTTKRTGVYRMNVLHNDQLIATFNGTVFRKADK